MVAPTHRYRRLIDTKPSSLCAWAAFLLLWPCSQLFALIVRLRAVLYARGVLAVYRPSVPVISVGNLAVGGTGKTPVTDALVKRLIARGLRVAVVSRGYGGDCAGPVGTVAAGDGCLLLSPQQAGDEPCLLARRNPTLLVFVAARRVRGVRAAEASGAQIVVLDDGFQHLAVRRDLDIVLLDSRAPFGNGQVLPAGPLREPAAALRRADLVIMTHAAAPPAPGLAFAGPVLHCRHRLGTELLTLDGVPVPWSTLDGQAALAFAGIARPEDFFAALRARGVTLSATLAFNDHQDYSGEQLNRLVQSCDNEKLLITTEKDAVKLRAADLPCPCLVAPLELAIDESDELDRALERVLRARRKE